MNKDGSIVDQGDIPSNEQLLSMAQDAMRYAYVPYSNFRVGAVLVAEDGTLHAGCNVENAAYSPTNCAERTALYRAIADGKQAKTFRAIAIIGATTEPITPCGVCRQVLVELCAPNMPVIMGNTAGQIKVMTVEQLLPGAFTSADL